MEIVIAKPVVFNGKKGEPTKLDKYGRKPILLNFLRVPPSTNKDNFIITGTLAFRLGLEINNQCYLLLIDNHGSQQKNAVLSQGIINLGRLNINSAIVIAKKLGLYKC